MTRLAGALVAAALLAGCLGAPAEEAAPSAVEREEAAGDDVAPQDDSPAPAPDAASTTAVAAAPPPAPARVDVPLAWDGKSRPLACVPRGLDTCSGPGTDNDGQEMHAPELPGVPVAFRVTMTWTAASPLTETMALHAIGLADCPDECAVTGASPLEFVLEGVAPAEGEALTFHVFAPGPCWRPCNGAKFFLDPGQEVHVEGTVTVVAGEAGTAAAGDEYEP